MNKSLILAVVLGLVQIASGQGPLAPPGPPGPTMKTLDQVEPRTAITNLPFIVSTSGSYYVTGNLSGPGGIVIDADDVTIDLNGFTLDGGFGGGPGIEANGFRQHLRVEGGRLTNWSGHGVNLESTMYADVVQVDVFGCSQDGIRVGERGRVKNCSAAFNGGAGFFGFFDSTIEDSRAEFNNFGMSLLERCVVRNCRMERNQTGMNAQGRATIIDCRVADNDQNGIEAYDGSTIIGNTVVSNGFSAILLIGNGGRVEGNTCRGNTFGLDLAGTDNHVRANLVSGNQINYQFQPGNKLELLLCELPEMIRWPAQVTLVGPLRCSDPGIDGLTVEASGVSIDLAGHTIEGPGFSSGHGIFQPSNGVHSLSVRNGSLSGWQGPDKAALRLEGSNNRIEGVQIFSNQMAVAVGPGAQVVHVQAFDNESSSIGPGVFAANGSVIRDCVVSGNRASGGTGIGVFGGDGSVIERCTVYSNEFFVAASSSAIGGGSGSEIRDCVAHGNTGANGITAITVIDGGAVIGCSSYNNVAMSGLSVGINGGTGTVIRDCSSHGNESFGSHVFGVAAGSGSTVSGCAVYRNGGASATSAGIFTLFDAMVFDCSVTQNTNHGIRVAGGCQVRDNQVNENGNIGIEAVQEGSTIERNQVKGSPFGISIVSSNNFIAANRVSSITSSNNFLIAVGNAHGPIVNVSGAGDLSLTPNADHPLANLSY